MPVWLKTSLKILGGLVLIIALLLTGIYIYIAQHKTKLLSLVTDELNKNLNGTLSVGNIETSFFEIYPNLSIKLKNVSLRDKEWMHHKHTLLQAESFDISVNTAALLKGAIKVNHIDIGKAKVYLYTDSTGYSNTSIFKKNRSTKDSKGNKSPSTQINKFSFRDVNFTVDDRQAKKLFSFVINELRSNMSFPNSGFNANLYLKIHAKSMAFSTDKGSFIKDKLVEGNLDAGYNTKTGNIDVRSSSFSIGGDAFTINAHFALNNTPATFIFHIKADQLLWSHASTLVTPNISLKLNMFNLDKPIAVTAMISGSFAGGGDPLLYITADVHNNRLSIPGAIIENCNFFGIFTNNYVKGKTLGDENSIISLSHFTGTYNHLPFAVDTGSIINLVKPIAAGNFRSGFPVTDLNYLIGGNAVTFTRGTADISLHFNADVVDYRINKPMIRGNINVKNADINYLSRNLTFKNTSLSLNFVENDLLLNNVRLQVGKSIIFMKARVNNFLNLYYNSPEKIMVNCQVTSPQLYLGEFLGFLGNTKSAAPTVKNKKNSTNTVSQLSVLNKAKIMMHIRAANVHYFKFLATDATAEMIQSEDGFKLENVSLKNAGGSLRINGSFARKNLQNLFKLNTVISNVDIHNFFYSFNSFGLKDLTYQNLKGFLSAKTQISGRITNAGDLVPGSVFGTADINLQDGALINYSPLINVGKFAFPFRDLHNIAIPLLSAKFGINGQKIIIYPLKISSSVLNADVAGVYSLTNETDISIDVPLRNPGKDAAISDTAKLAKRRYKGIVLHLRAKNDENGKLKIGLDKKKIKIL